ncbi:hypothetical protein BJV78DRAFT_1156491 [Lactifluus subvellereus]|nr:hypothetical protein BJV78DRAFT_1156491 [Lactifluus subvellereus]
MDRVPCSSTHAKSNQHESWAGLKRGPPRMSHARAYRRYAEETLHIVKRVARISDRARDAEFSAASHQTLNSSPPSIQLRLPSMHLSCKDSFPTPEQESSWVKSVWPVACNKTSTRLTPRVISPRGFYEFDTGSAAESLSGNTERARDLKTDLAFINGENGLPYRHPIIQQAVNVLSGLATAVAGTQMIDHKRSLLCFHNTKRSGVASTNG